MAENPNASAPLIAPATAGAMGMSIEIIADVDPKLFPYGLEVIVCAPGQIQPLGRGVVLKGCMLAVIPPELAGSIRAQLKTAKADEAVRRDGSKVKAPGVR